MSEAAIPDPALPREQPSPDRRTRAASGGRVDADASQAPLTRLQAEELDALVRLGNRVVPAGNPGRLNVFRSLRARGLAEWRDGGHNPDWWSATVAGRNVWLDSRVDAT